MIASLREKSYRAMWKYVRSHGRIQTVMGIYLTGAIMLALTCLQCRLLANLRLGGHFKTQLARLRRFLRQGELRFETFGHIDKISDFPVGKIALIDLDSHKSLAIPKLYAHLRCCGLRSLALGINRTRRGWHAAIVLDKKLPLAELIALQAVLGSDRMREAMNLMRVISIREHGGEKALGDFWKQRHNILFDYKL